MKSSAAESMENEGEKMLKEQLEKVRGQMPLIHNITNYVTVNDCANILLACGGSPIMADDWRKRRKLPLSAAA